MPRRRQRKGGNKKKNQSHPPEIELEPKSEPKSVVSETKMLGEPIKLICAYPDCKNEYIDWGGLCETHENMRKEEMLELEKKIVAMRENLVTKFMRPPEKFMEKFEYRECLVTIECDRQDCYREFEKNENVSMSATLEFDDSKGEALGCFPMNRPFIDLFGFHYCGFVESEREASSEHESKIREKRKLKFLALSGGDGVDSVSIAGPTDVDRENKEGKEEKEEKGKEMKTSTKYMVSLYYWPEFVPRWPNDPLEHDTRGSKPESVFRCLEDFRKKIRSKIDVIFDAGGDERKLVYCGDELVGKKHRERCTKPHRPFSYPSIEEDL